MKLKHDELLLSFAFNVNLRRYIQENVIDGLSVTVSKRGAAVAAEVANARSRLLLTVGRCRFNR